MRRNWIQILGKTATTLALVHRIVVISFNLVRLYRKPNPSNSRNTYQQWSQDSTAKPLKRPNNKKKTLK